jgi:hypothetical protein
MRPAWPCVKGEGDQVRRVGIAHSKVAGVVMPFLIDYLVLDV